VPMIYSWGIIKAFHTVFKKSIVEYTAKFISKCCQITIFELTGLYVTEAFVQYELKNAIQDPLLYDHFPHLKNKGFGRHNKDEEEKEKINEDFHEMQGLHSTAAIKNWKEYKAETRHSKGYFKDQKEKYVGLVNDYDKRYIIFMNRLHTMKSLQSPTHATNTGSQFFSPQNGTTDCTERPASTIFGTNSQINYPGLFIKATEEIIMTEEPYNSQVKSSQLSPFMTKYRDKYVSGHDVVVPYRFPDDVHMKSRDAQEYESRKNDQKHKKFTKRDNEFNGHHFGQNGQRAVSLEMPPISYTDTYIRPMPCICRPCLVEFFKKRNIPEHHIQKISEVIPLTNIQKRYDTRPKIIESKTALRRAQQEKLMEECRLKPEKKLSEANIFNDLYADIIKTDLASNIDNRKKINSELHSIPLNSPLKMRSKSRAINRKIFRSETPTRGETDLIKAEQIIAAKRGRTAFSRKARLSTVIKKLSAKYASMGNLKESLERISDNRKYDNFVNRIKENNESFKKVLIHVNYKVGHIPIQ